MIDFLDFFQSPGWYSRSRLDYLIHTRRLAVFDLTEGLAYIYEKMRIGFDLRPFLKEETGVGVYLKNLLFELAAMDAENEYFLFSASWKDRFAPRPPPAVRPYALSRSALAGPGGQFPMAGSGPADASTDSSGRGST